MLRVLLPTDFSDNAYSAIAYALRLYAKSTCTFYLLHTYTPAVYRAEYILQSPGQFGLGDVYQTLAMNRLEKLRKQLAKEFPNTKHRFVPHTAFNTLVDEVQEVVDNENIDIVVMGTQGATGAKEIFLGTNTVHVMKKVGMPLLVIPPNSTFEPIEKIHFPTDYEVDYKEGNLSMLFHLAKEHDASIEVMHVSTGYELTDDQKQNKAKLQKMMQGLPHRFHDWPSDEIITAINRFHQEHGTQLLAMIRNKHTFIERLFVEPIIKKISFHATIPFLVMPQES